MVLTDQDYKLLCKLIYDRTGIRFDERKKSFVETRVARRVQELGLDSGRSYFVYLRYQDDGTELQNFIESLTTNETYFFRDFPQLACFAEQVLPSILDNKRQRSDLTLRLLSAACSTGEEPYTLAIILREMIEDFPAWRTEIVAIDIDTTVLRVAEAGVYLERSVKHVPPPYLKKYFTQQGRQYVLRDEIKSMVRFERANLIDRRDMSRYRDFDVVFCRNVLIYFDDSSRRRAVGYLYESLRPGGYIFLGHSESMSRISAAFQPVRFGNHIVYQKPVSQLVHSEVGD